MGQYKRAGIERDQKGAGRGGIERKEEEREGANDDGKEARKLRQERMTSSAAICGFGEVEEENAMDAKWTTIDAGSDDDDYDDDGELLSSSDESMRGKTRVVMSRCEDAGVEGGTTRERGEAMEWKSRKEGK